MRKNNTELEYIILNKTDGILASPNRMTYEEAEQFVKDFTTRYTKQGYYLTATAERIAPEDVKLEILPAKKFFR